VGSGIGAVPDGDGMDSARGTVGLKYVAVRLAQIVPTFFLVMIIVFFLVRYLPGDPTSAVLGIRATEEAVTRINAQLGLDRPMIVQFWIFLQHFVRGDLLDSIILKVPVMQLIEERMPVTLFLTGLASLIAVLLAVPMALVSALERDKTPDIVIRSAFQIGLSMPVFYIGIVLLTFLAAPPALVPGGRMRHGIRRAPRPPFPPGAHARAQPAAHSHAQLAHRHHGGARRRFCRFPPRKGAAAPPHPRPPCPAQRARV